ncbi:hypothetical protein BCR36DRAFT_338509, partial [Piromyces finnis]
MLKLYKNNKRIAIYFFTYMTQLILMVLWTFSQDGVIKKTMYLDNYGSYDYNSCSTGNKYILSVIYGFDYILLIISIINAYRGRNLPDDFNYSKKIFMTSLVSFFMLLCCHLSIILEVEKTVPHFANLLLINVIILGVNITFI